MMKPENMKLLSDYVQCLHGSTIPYERRGKYVDAVWFFLCNTDSVDKRGYKQFCKQHSAYLVANQHIKEGILHFLAIKGIGYRKTAIKKASTSKLQLRFLGYKNTTCKNVKKTEGFYPTYERKACLNQARIPLYLPNISRCASFG